MIRLGAVFLVFLDDLRLLIARHVFVMAEFLGVNTAPARQGAQRAGIAVKILGRHVRLDDLKAAVHVHALNFSAPAREVAHDLAHTIFRDANFDCVDRLKHAGSRRCERFLERVVTRGLKGDVL